MQYGAVIECWIVKFANTNSIPLHGAWLAWRFLLLSLQSGSWGLELVKCIDTMTSQLIACGIISCVESWQNMTNEKYMSIIHDSIWYNCKLIRRQWNPFAQVCCQPVAPEHGPYGPPSVACLALGMVRRQTTSPEFFFPEDTEASAAINRSASETGWISGSPWLK